MMGAISPGPLGGRFKRGAGEPVYCSFCGLNQHEVETMIAGPVRTAICDRCVDQCAEIVAAKRAEKEATAAAGANDD
ncbi:MAG: hypothetical protein J0H17_03850 [Rhizobiales bacterium]|nr:hypothetical protein [Hyphomicrobiales bacterium]